MTSSSSSSSKGQVFLVVGATGATGRHVVAQLLTATENVVSKVKVIVRSATKMRALLSELKVKESSSNGVLDIMEASLLDLTDKQLIEYTADVDVVISCLGHNMTWKGLYGHPRQLVTDATRRLTNALEQQQQQSKDNDNHDDPTTKKFILMGSDGVAWHGNDDVRPFLERLIISIIRYLVPPHRDNEMAAAYLLNKKKEKHGGSVEWVIVRPTDLVDESTTTGSYQLYSKPQGSLFGSGTATRLHVAKAMVSLATTASLWSQWKFKMPVLVDDKAPCAAKDKVN